MRAWALIAQESCAIASIFAEVFAPNARKAAFVTKPMGSEMSRYSIAVAPDSSSPNACADAFAKAFIASFETSGRLSGAASSQRKKKQTLNAC